MYVSESPQPLPGSRKVGESGIRRMRVQALFTLHLGPQILSSRVGIYPRQSTETRGDKRNQFPSSHLSNPSSLLCCALLSSASLSCPKLKVSLNDVNPYNTTSFSATWQWAG